MEESRLYLNILMVRAPPPEFFPGYYPPGAPLRRNPGPGGKDAGGVSRAPLPLDGLRGDSGG